MAVYVKVDVGVPNVHGPIAGSELARLATTAVFEMHDMHLQVPGGRAARDQRASIAIGACFTTSDGGSIAAQGSAEGLRGRIRGFAMTLV